MHDLYAMFRDRRSRTFLVIWLGQVVSILGTGMTRFALMIWAYDQTGHATTLALLGFSAYITYVFVSPLAGVWVDRWDRRRVMIGSDLGAGVITLSLFALFAAGELSIWHLYLAEALTGICEGFQHPAYSASVTLLIPRDQLVRANALRSLGGNTTTILAPALAGLVLHWAGLRAVMLIDVVTFGVAMLTLAAVRIPAPPESEEGRATRDLTWRAQIMFGLRYIGERAGLLRLLIVFSLIYFFAALTYFSILPAMVLARSGGDELALSGVQSALGIGGVVGSVILAVWGGPRRKIHGVLAFCAASFWFGDMLFAVGRTPLAWMGAAFAAAVFIPFIGSAHQAIWQTKVPPDVQGRVLSFAFGVQQMTLPLGFLIAGPLADHVFEPAMLPGGALAGIFGGLVGTGAGAGMGLMFMITCLAGTTVCLGGYLSSALRNVERDLPDCTPLPAEPDTLAIPQPAPVADALTDALSSAAD